jgi:hypothetical protein
LYTVYIFNRYEEPGIPASGQAKEDRCRAEHRHSRDEINGRTHIIATRQSRQIQACTGQERNQSMLLLNVRTVMDQKDDRQCKRTEPLRKGEENTEHRLI